MEERMLLEISVRMGVLLFFSWCKQAIEKTALDWDPQGYRRRGRPKKIYRTLVRPAVTYGSESWTLTMEEERALAVLERKILWKIYGPVKENELWRTRQNDELEAIIKGQNIVRFIICQKMRWLGHIERMQDTAIPKKDAVQKAVCNKTKRKTKNEMAGG